MKERSSVVVEEYLQAIYSLLSDDKPVKAVSLAKWLKSSPSTVHATLSRMQRDKLVRIGDKKEIKLTPSGMKLAEQLTRRHRLVESFLCDVLGISWYEVHTHAHVLEHGLTPLVEEKLAAFMGNPKACPHGTPIPGENNLLPEKMSPVSEYNVGDHIEIIIVDESLEESLELMKFLQDKQIVPGGKHEVVDKMEITKTIALKANEGVATLPFHIAEKIGAIKI